MLEKPAGKRRNQLDEWFSGPQGPQSLFAGRILSFDDKAGLVWAELMAEGKVKGLDTIIAAIADDNDCIVVTDNERDFAGIEIINPIRGGNRCEPGPSASMSEEEIAAERFM